MNIRPRVVVNQWEGVYAAGFTLEEARRRCYRLGTALAAHNLACLVAYDTRFMSALFARDLFGLMGTQGVTRSLAAMPAPLPAIHLALEQRRVHTALLVSARNRPYWYNGLVFIAPPDIETTFVPSDAPLPSLPFPPPSDLPPPNAADQLIDLRGPYLEQLRGRVDIELIRRATLTIFVDPMSGTTAGYLPSIIAEGAQTRAIEINRESDPLFGRVTPLPSESGLTRLRKLVRESDSHLGLACSADGTAIGVVDKQGEQLELIELVLLLAGYLTRNYRQRGLVIAPPPTPTSQIASLMGRMERWEDSTGLKLEVTADTSGRIAEALAQERPGLLIGCTSEGEMILGRFAAQPDALLAGLLLIECVARHGGNLRALVEDLRGLLARP